MASFADIKISLSMFFFYNPARSFHFFFRKLYHHVPIFHHLFHFIHNFNFSYISQFFLQFFLFFFLIHHFLKYFIKFVKYNPDDITSWKVLLSRLYRTSSAMLFLLILPIRYGEGIILFFFSLQWKRKKKLIGAKC